MPDQTTPQAKLTPVAYFPKQYFLENLAIRRDNSVLVTVANQSELWYVPPVHGPAPVEATCIHKFADVPCGIVETEPDVFYLISGNFYTTHEAYLHHLNLRGWTPGQPLKLETVFQFPDTAKGLNGVCLIAPRIMLVADSLASLIWRVDLPTEEGGQPTARVWLKHESMGYYPGELKPEQPGVNGVRYAAKTHHLYYTATAKKLFMRVPVDPGTHEPAGEPELVVAGRTGDDFCLDEENEVIYLTTHRQNTIDRVWMEPGKNSGFTESVAGDLFTEQLIGPSSGAWGRGPGEEMGKIAYFLTDGGTASPRPDGPHPATLVRVEFRALPNSSDLGKNLTMADPHQTVSSSAKTASRSRPTWTARDRRSSSCLRTGATAARITTTSPRDWSRRTGKSCARSRVASRAPGDR